MLRYAVIFSMICSTVTFAEIKSASTTKEHRLKANDLTVEELARVVDTMVHRALEEQRAPAYPVLDIAPAPSEEEEPELMPSQAFNKRAKFQFYASRGKKAMIPHDDEAGSFFVKRFSYMPSRG